MAQKTLGEYTLGESLGRGGFGTVYKATRLSGILTLEYALKTLHKEQTDAARFRTEAESWARVSNPPHENVVPLHFAGVTESGEYVLASDFCTGGTLESWLEAHEGKAPTLAQALELFEGILRGLAHLHANQIVHCDLKPANILLQGSTPKLSDFGFARTVKDTVDISKFAGTNFYKSWDVIRQKHQNEPEDTWAAGVIFCRLLGFMPFTLDAIFDRLPPTFPADLNPALRPFLEKALDHERGNRFPNGEEMLAEFLRLRELLQTAREREERQRAEIAEMAMRQALTQTEKAEAAAAETLKRAETIETSVKAREEQALRIQQEAEEAKAIAADMTLKAQQAIQSEEKLKQQVGDLRYSECDMDEKEGDIRLLKEEISNKEKELNEYKKEIDRLNNNMSSFMVFDNQESYLNVSSKDYHMAWMFSIAIIILPTLFLAFSRENIYSVEIPIKFENFSPHTYFNNDIEGLGYRHLSVFISYVLICVYCRMFSNKKHENIYSIHGLICAKTTYAFCFLLFVFLSYSLFAKFLELLGKNTIMTVLWSILWVLVYSLLLYIASVVNWKEENDFVMDLLD